MGNEIKVLPAFISTAYTPSLLRPSDNALSVDFGGDLEMVEVAEELNDVAKLKESSTFDTDLPITTINRWIVGAYGNKIPILVNAWGVQLPDTQLLINAINEVSNQYDVSFIRNEEWPEFLKRLPLRDIDGFDPFQMSEAFVDDNHLNDAAYDGETRGFYLPIAYYGGLNRFNKSTSTFELTYADYRPWFHYAKVLEQAFSAAGWSMDCPLLRTDFGQRMVGYFAECQIYDGFASFHIGQGATLQPTTYADKLQLPCSKHYAFKVSNSAPQTITGAQDPLWFDSEAVIFDNDTTGGNFDNGSAVAEGFFDTTVPAIQGFSGKWRYRIRLRVTGGASPISASVGFFPNATAGPVNLIQTIFFDAGGNRIGVDVLQITVPGGSVTVDLDLYATVESILSWRDIVFGFAFGDGSGLTIEEQSWIEGTGEFIVMTTQPLPLTASPDIINETVVFPQSWLSSKVMAIEVLESYCHRTNSKIYSDRARRIVGIYTEQDIPTYGEATEPYYFKDIETDLSGMQVLDSATINLKEALAPARYILGFKTSTDSYIESVSKGEPYEATIGLDGFASNIDQAKETENRDALTEPTLERPFVEIRSQNPFHVSIDVPTLWDNAVGEPSTKIGVRTGYAYGLVKQRREPGSTTFKKYRTMVNGVPTTKELFAYVTHFPSNELVDGSDVEVLNDKTIVYDHTAPVSEPMKRYWIDKIRREYRAEARKLTLIIGSFNQFIGLNFRNLFNLSFRGIGWKGRLTQKRTKVNDFRAVEVELTEDIEC